MNIMSNFKQKNPIDVKNKLDHYHNFVSGFSSMTLQIDEDLFLYIKPKVDESTAKNLITFIR